MSDTDQSFANLGEFLPGQNNNRSRRQICSFILIAIAILLVVLVIFIGAVYLINNMTVSQTREERRIENIQLKDELNRTIDHKFEIVDLRFEALNESMKQVMNDSFTQQRLSKLEEKVDKLEAEAKKRNEKTNQSITTLVKFILDNA